MVYLEFELTETNQGIDDSSRYDTERNLDEDMLPSCDSGS